MSAPADSTGSGANAVTAETARLDQPNDAVPMENMSQSTPIPEQPATKEPEEPSSSGAVPVEAEKEEQDVTDAAASHDQSGDAIPPKPPLKERQESVMAIGPAQDDIRAVTDSGPDAGPVCNITLLLTSGGRHPYKIDSKYLSRRNVSVPEEAENGQPDPFSISVYTLKELILREWRSDWEAKPASPTSIRLIHFGKLLDDKDPLKKYQFSTENPNVVHMSIRPQDLDEEEPKAGNKNQSSGGGDGQRSRGGCCVVL